MTGGRDTAKLNKRNDTLAIGTHIGFMLNDSIRLRRIDILLKLKFGQMRNQNRK
jgi:hypothetical protein